MTKPKIVTSKSKYIDQFQVLNSASVGVVITPTKEPMRVVETFKEYCVAQKWVFGVWDVTSGWTAYSTKEPILDGKVPEKSIPNTNQPVQALEALTEGKIPSAPYNFGKETDGIYVMNWLHHFHKNPMVIQMIANYAHLWTSSAKRLVIVTPDANDIPREIESLVHVLDYDLPKKPELKESFLNFFNNSVLPQFDESVPIPQLGSIDSIVDAGSGLTLYEFETAVARFCIENSEALPSINVEDCARHIIDIKTEVVKKSQVLEMMKPVDINSVGGLDVLKKWIDTRKNCFTKEAKDFGIEMPKGVFLVGSPGTGKSLSAKVVSGVLNVPLIRFDVSRVFNSLVGSSEGRIKDALAMIHAMAPCVVLIDEVDKVFDVNGSGDSGVSKRILGSILTDMQENNDGVFWILTANRVDNLPSELMRKGRLDEIFSVNTPNAVERKDILNIHLNKRGHDPKKIKDLDKAIAASEGYVGAEIEAAVKESLIAAFSNKQPVSGDLIVEELKAMKPISESFKDQFDAMSSWAEQNARKASSDTSLYESSSEVSPPPTRKRLRNVNLTKKAS